MMRIYHKTDNLIYKNIQQDSDIRLIFFSGMGSPIRSQREAFFRRFALTNGISYLALDYTKYALQHKYADHFQIDTFFDRTKEILAQCSEDKFLIFGACFGGLMGLKVTQAIPSKVSGVVLTSPAYETPLLPWIKKADSFLHKKFNEKTKDKNISLNHLRRMAILHQLFVSTLDLARSPISHTYQGPMTIFHGEKDNLIPPENSLLIQKQMKNPNVQLRIIPGMKHTLAMDREMKYPLSILAGYLNKIKSP